MQYDAAIIGAGPAGATFARRLAQQSPELKILLLDAQDEGHKKPCGGLLAPDAQKTLAHFDLVLPKSVGLRGKVRLSPRAGRRGRQNG